MLSRTPRLLFADKPWARCGRRHPTPTVSELARRGPGSRGGGCSSLFSTSFPWSDFARAHGNRPDLLRRIAPGRWAVARQATVARTATATAPDDPAGLSFALGWIAAVTSVS